MGGKRKFMKKDPLSPVGKGRRHTILKLKTKKKFLGDREVCCRGETEELNERNEKAD